jgi:EthD domain
MYKIVALLTRKKGMSMQEFIDYYENHHTVLARELFPEVQDYRRKYVMETGPHSSDDPVGFDCILELTFNSEADAQAMYGRLANNPEVARRVAEDEEKLFDRSRIKTLIIDERVSPPPVR